MTGIAGPSGGSLEKPVGTVYIGLATDQGEDVWHYQFHGNRAEIKTLTAETALDRLRRELKSYQLSAVSLLEPCIQLVPKLHLGTTMNARLSLAG